MKIKNSLIFLLIIFFCQACKKEIVTDNTGIIPTTITKNDSISQKLSAFYREYFAEMESSSKTSEQNLDLLKKKYLSAELYKKIKVINLDYDPIINGQDVDSEWRKSLKISHVKSDIYEMCTKSSFNHSQYCSTLKIGNAGGKIKILDIKVNDIPSILNYMNLEDIDSDIPSKTDTVPTGIWQISCNSDCPKIEFFDNTSATLDFKTKSNLLARINLKVEKNEDTYILFFDGITGITKGNDDIDWGNLSRSQEIGRVIFKDNNITLNWLGFYNDKEHKKENPFSNYSNQISLIKCNN